MPLKFFSCSVHIITKQEGKDLEEAEGWAVLARCQFNFLASIAGFGRGKVQMCCSFRGAEHCTSNAFWFFFKDWSRYLWFQWQHHRRTLQTVDASGSILPVLQEPQLWRFRSKLCFLLKITVSYTTTCPLISLLIITLTEFENRTVLMKSEIWEAWLHKG